MKWLRSFWEGLTTPMPADPGGDPAQWWGERSTPRVCQAIALARREADRLRHGFIGTEHLLLGLIRLGKGTAVAVLQSQGIDLDVVRKEIENSVRPGPELERNPSDPVRYTPRVKRVFSLATEESRAMNHTYIGTEHLLLALLAEGDGVAGRILKNLNLELRQMRAAVLKELDPNLNFASFDPPGGESGLIDASKRYDIYCREGDRETMVVYRNALFKGVKALGGEKPYTFPEFVEIEQADGGTVFLSKFSVIRFCEPGVKPGGEGEMRKEE